jgi:ribosomal-protein-alanine N-acetyltransferase
MASSYSLPSMLSAKPLQQVGLSAAKELFSALEGDPHFRPHGFDAATAEAVLRYQGRDRYLVASRADSLLVGYGMLRGWDQGFEIPSLGLATRPGHRGQGVGNFLLNALHAVARGSGAGLVRLRVHHDNHVARALYARHGYCVVDEERGQLVMLRAL